MYCVGFGVGVRFSGVLLSHLPFAGTPREPVRFPRARAGVWWSNVVCSPCSVRDLIAAVLAKVEGIERRLQDLSVMRDQLRDLPAMRTQLALLERGVQQSLGAIEARTEELAVSVRRVDARQADLDTRVRALETRPSGGPGDIEECLEAPSVLGSSCSA